MDLADREWAAWTDPIRRPPGKPLPGPVGPADAALASAEAATKIPPGIADAIAHHGLLKSVVAGRAAISAAPAARAPPERLESVASATERLRSAQADLAEIKLAEQRGELVLAIDVERRLAAEVSSCRTRLLAIPGRARQIIPELSATGTLALEDLIREVLTELSGPEL